MVAPRVYHGEYTLQETVILTQLNLNMQARDLERMKNELTFVAMPELEYLIDTCNLCLDHQRF